MTQRKQIIQKIIDKNPRAVLTKNKYKVLTGMIRRMFPNNYEKLPPQIWEKIIYEAVNGDRDWRILTQGKDKNKVLLSQEWMINNGYDPNYKNDVRKLKTL